MASVWDNKINDDSFPGQETTPSNLPVEEKPVEDLPEGLNKTSFNWGAFLLPCIWGIRHKSKLSYGLLAILLFFQALPLIAFAGILFGLSGRISFMLLALLLVAMMIIIPLWLYVVVTAAVIVLFVLGNLIPSIGAAALISIVPDIIIILMVFKLAAKGDDIAWSSGRYSDVDGLRKSQRRWTISGIAVLVVAVLITGVFWAAALEANRQTVQTSSQCDC